MKGLTSIRLGPPFSIFSTADYRRLPTDADDLQDLFDKKRRGQVDLPTKEEEANVPAPVQAIIMKALRPNPSDRYQSIKDLARDLANFQAGQAVSVYRDSLFAFIKRWYLRNQRHLIYGAFILMILLTAGTLLWRERLKEVAYWGLPVYQQDFTDDFWKDYWVKHQGKFRKGLKGDIVSAGTHSSSIVFREKLYGSTAVVIEAEMLPGYPPGDLSLMWIEGLEWDGAGKVKKTRNTYYFQTGTFDNSFCMIQRYPLRLAFSPQKLKIGETYLIRIEIDLCVLRLFLDGEKICEYRRYMPFDQGHVGIYAYHPGKSFRSIKIYSKGVPEKVSILTVGDEIFRERDFAAAAKSYAKVAGGTKNPRIRQEALYRQGLSLFMLKDEQAMTVWEEVKAPKLKQRVLLHKIRGIFEKKDYATSEAEPRKLYGKADKDFHTEIEMEWAHCLQFLLNNGNFPVLRRFLKLQEELFPDKPIHRYTTVTMLGHLGEHEKIIAEYRDYPHHYLVALTNRGELTKVISTPLGLKNSQIDAMILAGQYEEIIRRFPEKKFECARALLEQGSYNELLTKFPDQKGLSPAV